eukprot:Selendium_serpulae@DN5347_c0_g2_i1.p1
MRNIFVKTVLFSRNYDAPPPMFNVDPSTGVSVKSVVIRADGAKPHIEYKFYSSWQDTVNELRTLVLSHTAACVKRSSPRNGTADEHKEAKQSSSLPSDTRSFISNGVQVDLERPRIAPPTSTADCATQTISAPEKPTTTHEETQTTRPPLFLFKGETVSQTFCRSLGKIVGESVVIGPDTSTPQFTQKSTEHYHISGTAKLDAITEPLTLDLAAKKADEPSEPCSSEHTSSEEEQTQPCEQETQPSGTPDESPTSSLPFLTTVADAFDHSQKDKASSGKVDSTEDEQEDKPVLQGEDQERSEDLEDEANEKNQKVLKKGNKETKVKGQVAMPQDDDKDELPIDGKRGVLKTPGSSFAKKENKRSVSVTWWDGWVSTGAKKQQRLPKGAPLFSNGFGRQQVDGGVRSEIGYDITSIFEEAQKRFSAKMIEIAKCKKKN